jgi:hypothetical protein
VKLSRRVYRRPGYYDVPNDEKAREKARKAHEKDVARLMGWTRKAESNKKEGVVQSVKRFFKVKGKDKS